MPSIGEIKKETFLEQTEATIRLMQNTSLAVNPSHYHAFQKVSYPSMLRLFPRMQCVGCKRPLLNSVLWRSVPSDSTCSTGDGAVPVENKETCVSNGSSGEVVRCIACGVYAHRGCSFSSSSLEICTVNKPVAENASISNEEKDSRNDASATEISDQCVLQEHSTNSCPDKCIIADQVRVKEEICPISSTVETDSICKQDSTSSCVHNEDHQDTPKSSKKEHECLSNGEKSFPSSPGTDDQQCGAMVDNDSSDPVWKNDGPPSHWALQRPETLDGLPSSALQGTVSYLDSSLSSVSKVLQENVAFFFSGKSKKPPPDTDDLSQSGSSPVPSVPEESFGTMRYASSKEIPADESVDMNALLSDIDSASTSPPSSESPSPAKSAFDIMKRTGKASIGIATVGGKIVGGVAGLAVAGPIGAVIGGKIGSAFGMLAFLIQGRTVLVIGAGAVATGFAVQKAVKEGKLRLLTIGETAKHRVVLVRPYVEVDPEWEAITATARISAPTAKRKFLFGTPSPDIAQEQRERMKRDVDIVEAEKSEINTHDKILLLVSRSLNDKHSLPGHVHRCLINIFREREQERNGTSKEDVIKDERGESNIDLSKNNDNECVSSPSRAVRQDVHAIILHVTATLMEVRPGFGASPIMTEMSATAVENIVFGELYDLIFGEIVAETKEKDQCLMVRIQEFETKRRMKTNVYEQVNNSVEALKSLQMLPEAHSAVEKLASCVRFLESVSVQYSADCNGMHSAAMGADSLLKLVCQHIIYAKTPCLFAEIGFLEEFARDDYLLRGKEGYALVTMQASLHFLNSSTDFERDIFQEKTTFNK